MTKIKRALISVSDKTGLATLALALQDMGVEILSTGGTSRFLKDHGIKVKEVSEFTGFAEILDGRVKTLHPKIHGGLLALRRNVDHQAQVKKHGLEYLDLAVVNLYPFEKTLNIPKVTKEEIIENIDIGGPAMLRSAAKNYQEVVVICDPRDYGSIITELQDSQGDISLATKEKLAGKVFTHTAAYDSIISNYFASQTSQAANLLPETLLLKLNKVQSLRYGENPHQQAALYQQSGVQRKEDLVNLEQLHGKELSFNNLLDLETAWNIVKDFGQEKVAVMVKHNNPCGVGKGDTLLEAYQRALSCDPVSAYGGVVATSFTIDEESAREMNRLFLELTMAPAYTAEALKILKEKKNLRLIELPLPKLPAPASDFKKISGGFLVQEKDIMRATAELKVVTKRPPSEAERQALIFAWIICKNVKSNAIVYASKNQTIGIGGGQTSRVDSSEIAVWKAQKHNLNTKGTVVASDAFFPFRDGVDAAAKAGATAIIQPGGSVRDEEVIQACNENNIAMVFTGIRHFKH
ncbi:MAG: bifunctional phosphoribosylaminoimidazolecarboxamide formyltransferase/IMP cyclohydrolase [Elusimicrobia bacterium]|nr:bifunctional phosphoribosylaminoimidazolecarboxamide formyltransferase/IMP cyclohydrolase [Elusimicrobiota bacterium]